MSDSPYSNARHPKPPSEGVAWYLWRCAATETEPDACGAEWNGDADAGLCPHCRSHDGQQVQQLN